MVFRHGVGEVSERAWGGKRRERMGETQRRRCMTRGKSVDGETETRANDMLRPLMTIYADFRAIQRLETAALTLPGLDNDEDDLLE